MLDKHKILSLYLIWEKSCFYIFVCRYFQCDIYYYYYYYYFIIIIIIFKETQHLHREQALLTMARLLGAEPAKSEHLCIFGGRLEDK